MQLFKIEVFNWLLNKDDKHMCIIARTFENFEIEHKNVSEVKHRTYLQVPLELFTSLGI